MKSVEIRKEVLTSTQQADKLGEKSRISAWVLNMTFGDHLRKLRKEKGFTLRGLADAVKVDFSYLSKIENEKAGYLPGADLIRSLAEALETDPLELLRIADKVPPEVEAIASDAKARRFLQRAQEVASPEDWDALLGLLERRHKRREKEQADE